MVDVSDWQISSVRAFLDKKKSELSHYQRKKEEIGSGLSQAKQRAEAMKKARIVIQAVAQETQKNLEYHISEPVTAAIRSVLPDRINFIARIVIKTTICHCNYGNLGHRC